MKMYLKLLIFFLILTVCVRYYSADLPLLRSPMTVLLEDQIQPRYISLAFEASALRNMAAEFCQNPHNKNFGLLQQQWRITMLSWQSAMACNLLDAIEPVDAPSLLNSVSKNTPQEHGNHCWSDQAILLTETKHEPYLNKQAATAEDRTLLQSLRTTEHLLFDTKTKQSMALKKNEYCQFLLDTTEVLLTNATKLQTQWGALGSYQQKLMKIERNEYGLGLEFWVLNSLLINTGRLQNELTQLQAKRWRSRQTVENIRAVLATFDTLVALAIEQSSRVERANAWQPAVQALDNLSLSIKKLPMDFTSGSEEMLHHAQRQLLALTKGITETAYQLGVRIGDF